MYVANPPSFFSDYVQARLDRNGNGGRPHFLTHLSKDGDVHEEALTICELAWLKNRTPRSIANHYMRKGFRISRSTIFRMLQDLEPDQEDIINFLQNFPRRKTFYNSELDSSDYETVATYIRTAKRNALRNYRRNIKNASRCWKALGYKDPKKWKADDVLDFLATLKPSAQSCMLDSVRRVAPQLADKNSTEYIGTARFREKVGRRKKDLFGAEVKLIHEALISHDLTFETIIFDLHVTLGAREGSKNSDSGMCGLTWDRFKEQFKRVDLYESKVRGGIWCRDCPTDLFFPHLPNALRKLWKERSKPTTDKLIVGGYKELISVYRRIRNYLTEYYKGKLDPSLFKELTTLRPHDADKIHCNLLWEAGVSLEVVAGQYLGQGEGIGLMGRIWLDVNTIKKHYLSLTARSERFQKIRREVTKYSQRFNGNQ